MKYLLLAAIVLAVFGRACDRGSGQAEEETVLDTSINFTPYNLFAGTQTIGYKYGFTEEQGLLETAGRIKEMGSNIIKFALSGGEKNPGLSAHASTLKGWVSDVPEIVTVLEMDFKYYFLWAYGPSSFGDGMTESEMEEEYEAIYDMTVHLLNSYNYSGKEFYIGNWEGDWHLYADFNVENPPGETMLNGMRQWFDVRQQAVDDAKADTPHEDVSVYHYAELNLPTLGMEEKPSISHSILPHLNVDYVSYSCYDVIYPNFSDTAGLRKALHEVLDYIEQQLPPKQGIEGKRVFIGEYGFALKYCEGEQQQKILSRSFLNSAISWGCPFVLYWAFYCNEKQQDGSYNGFWMIDNNDVKQPVYFEHKDYYYDLKLKIQNHIRQNQKEPDEETIRQFALSLL
jgi:hypothetical protein